MDDPRWRPGARAGYTLPGILVFIVIATLSLNAAVFLTVTEERSAAAAAQIARMAPAAEALLAEMEALLIAHAQARSGALSDGDMVLLNAAVASLDARDENVDVDLGATGWRVTAMRENERLTHDATPIAIWSDQPRLSYAAIPPVGGLVAARTLVVTIYVTVQHKGGGSHRVRRDVAISQVPPHQFALYAGGDAEVCASGSAANVIGGLIRIDGELRASSCRYFLRYAGGIEARDGIVVATPSTHLIISADGQHALATVTRGHAEEDTRTQLGAWGGRVRISAALGGSLGTSRLSSTSVAGVGECDEVPTPGALTCDGAARYFPSVQVQRTTQGAGTELTVTCGAAYNGGCSEAVTGITYHPWPFATAPAGAGAASDPAAPGFPWRGLLPDARRETRCTAAAGAIVYRTARCPTNVYGFRIDISALPQIAGGVLSIRRAAAAAPGANPSGAQEIVLLTNATSLAGPLTIHSEVPVYVQGSFNIGYQTVFNGPPPAMIHAPRIVLLPNEAAAQLRTSAVWDSVARAGATTPSAAPLHAESNVTIYAVLRSGFCGSVDGRYYGGLWEGVPAVLGDWRAANLRIIGAIEARQDETTSTACERYAAPLTATRSGAINTQPASRTVLHDPRLLQPQFQPPGSWSHQNVAYSGPSSIPSRPLQRQLRAIGGTVVVRRIRDLDRGSLPIPPAVGIRPDGPLPTPPPPLP